MNERMDEWNKQSITQTCVCLLAIRSFSLFFVCAFLHASMLSCLIVCCLVCLLVCLVLSFCVCLIACCFVCLFVWLVVCVLVCMFCRLSLLACLSFACLRVCFFHVCFWFVWLLTCCFYLRSVVIRALQGVFVGCVVAANQHATLNIFDVLSTALWMHLRVA